MTTLKLVTAAGHGARMNTWNPWAHLRANPHVTLAYHPSARAAGGGLSLQRGSRAVIVLDPSLGRRARRAVLAHELVHLERGGIIDPPGGPAAWDAVVAREEAAVDRTVAARLVPQGALEHVVARMCDAGTPVTADTIADEFDVPVRVASVALGQLAAAVRS